MNGCKCFRLAIQMKMEVNMNKVVCFVLGCLAGAASVVTAALVSDSIQQSGVILGEDNAVEESNNADSEKIEH